MTTLSEHIRSSEALIQWLDNRTGEPKIPSAFRSSAECLSAARAHQRAIVLLVGHSLPASAFALARPLFEAYVRGAWLHQCATDDDVNKFQNDKLDRSFGSLVADLEKLDGFNVGVLSAVKANSWEAMCSFTHTGFHQAVRNSSANYIEPNYTEAEQCAVLDWADGIGMMVFVEMAHQASDDYLALALLEKAKEVETKREPGQQ